VQREVQLFSSFLGVILSAAVVQPGAKSLPGAEPKGSCAQTSGAVLGSPHARALTRLNCAGFRDDASKKCQRSKLHCYRKSRLIPLAFLQR